MSIYISGSMAFDRIMTFGGHFSDHIMPDQIEKLSLSFLLNSLTEKRGGTAGNIAYTLALLGERPYILSSVGKDFASYQAFLEQYNLPMDGIKVIPDDFTAGCYIMTDQRSSQIAGFNPAAMSVPTDFSFPQANIATDIALVSPGNMDDMAQLPIRYKQMGMRYIFDPGQQVVVLPIDAMLEAIAGSKMLISNGYELELIMRAAGKSKAELLEMTDCILTTLGDEGSLIATGGEEVIIPCATPLTAADPTGAGDAYRSGLLKGLVNGLNVEAAARLGATCASFCVEKVGTQEHNFTMEEFKARYEASFGPMA